MRVMLQSGQHAFIIHQRGGIQSIKMDAFVSRNEFNTKDKCVFLHLEPKNEFNTKDAFFFPIDSRNKHQICVLCNPLIDTF